MKHNFFMEEKSNGKWLGFALIILFSLGIFCWLAINVRAGKTFLIDKEAFAITFALRSHFMNILMEWVTFLGSSSFLLPANILMILGILFYKKDRLVALQWAITASTSYLFMYFLKGMFQRSRPFDPYLGSATGFSFPSGHTLNGLVFFGLIILSLWKYTESKTLQVWGLLLVILIILAIGLSRIYLHVHYASDVLGGIALGVCLLTISIYLFGLFEKRNKSSI